MVDDGSNAEAPSANVIGQEFVRQYYTLMNKAPSFIYKFYGKKSTYVRGEHYNNGLPAPYSEGQELIKQKIEELDFQDCRTKIKQVDAYPSIGNGVVVQVAGEMSNRGLPLRRFMQTFFLAPQGLNQGDNPCKFYVHNDIFRYQDVVFMDEVPEEEPAEVVETQQEHQVVAEGEPAAYLQHNGVAGHQETPEVSESEAPVEVEAVDEAAAAEQVTEQPPVESAPVAEPTLVESSPSPVVEETYVAAPEPVAAAEPVETDFANAAENAASPATPQPQSADPSEPAAASPEVATPQVPAAEQPAQEPEQPAAPVQPPPVKTFSWADITSKGTKPSSGFASVPPPVVHKPAPTPSPVAQPPQQSSADQQQPPQDSTAEAPSGGPPTSQQPTPAAGHQREPRVQRGPRRNGGGGYRGGDNDDNGGYRPRGDRDDRPKTPRYPDNQQIFVGNLVGEITDSDLRNHFSEFGTVIDVKINYSHGSSPNFGFVIFEDPRSVEQVLNVKPANLKNHRINIEEKKQRASHRGNGDRMMRQNGGGDRPDGGYRRGPRNQNNGGGPQMRSSQQGGPRGGPQQVGGSSEQRGGQRYNRGGAQR